MTGFNYARAVQTADRLIRRFGAMGSIRRGMTDYPAALVIDSFANSEIDGTRVKATDKKAYVAAKGLSVEPKTSDRLVDADGGVYAIVNVVSLRPGTTTVFYEFQVRK